MKQERGAVKVWIKTRHGKRTINRHVVAGVLPRNVVLGVTRRREAKMKIREEYLRTGRVLSQQRVEEIVAALALERALIGDVIEKEEMLHRLSTLKIGPWRGR